MFSCCAVQHNDAERTVEVETAETQHAATDGPIVAETAQTVVVTIEDDPQPAAETETTALLAEPGRNVSIESVENSLGDKTASAIEMEERLKEIEDQEADPGAGKKSLIKGKSKRSEAGGDQNAKFRERVSVCEISKKPDAFQRNGKDTANAYHTWNNIDNGAQMLNRSSTVHSVHLIYAVKPDQLHEDAEAERTASSAAGSIDGRTESLNKMPSAFGPGGARSESSSHKVAQVGDIEEHYDLQDELGKGAFGVVSTAVSKADGKTYAIKTIHVSAVEEHQMLDMFNTEMAIGQTLDHPHIIWLVATFQNSDSIFLVMEHLTGGDLFDKIAQKQTGFSKRVCCKMIWEMLAGVTYLHYHKIAHRDIKPENFLFESKAKEARLKLIDFGLSKVFDGKKRMMSMVGSLQYAAPEILLGKGYTEKVDVWSVGVVSFLCASGFLPIYHAEEEKMVMEIKRCNVNWGAMLMDAHDNQKELIMTMLTEESKREVARHFADNEWLRKVALSQPACCGLLG